MGAETKIEDHMTSSPNNPLNPEALKRAREAAEQVATYEIGVRPHLVVGNWSDVIESAIPAYLENMPQVSECRLTKTLCEIVDGWGEPRHDKRLGFTAARGKITCGDVYEFVDAVRAPPSSSTGEPKP